MNATRFSIAASILSLTALASFAANASEALGEKAVFGYHLASAKAQLSAGETLESDTLATIAGRATIDVAGQASADLSITTQTLNGAYKVRVSIDGPAGKSISTTVMVNGEARPADVVFARAEGCSDTACPAAVRLTVQLGDGHALDLHVPAQAK
jgi:hypothetical protein